MTLPSFLAAERGFGFDGGTSRLVIARADEDNSIQTKSVYNGFCSLPHSRLVASTVDRLGFPNLTVDGNIIVTGINALQIANVFRVNTLRPLEKGVLNRKEPLAQLVLSDLAGQLSADLPRVGAPLAISVPAPSVDANSSVNPSAIRFHGRVLCSIFEKLGFKPTTVSEGLAVVFAELADSNYSGIGISCGAGLCNVSFAYLGVPVLEFSIEQGGDFIDQSAAAATGETASRVQVAKERELSLLQNGTGLSQALRIFYEELLDNLTNTLAEQLSKSTNMPHVEHPLPIVLAGGTASCQGFKKMFTDRIDRLKLPIPISEVRMSAEPLTATARGALIRALYNS